MRKKIVLFLLFFAISFIAIFNVVSAGIGVGVGAGKIRVDQELKPGVIYNLPPIPVINTGDVAGGYEMEVIDLQDQEELIPEEDWFSFSPREFYLDPGGTQVVKVAIIAPMKTEPGDYFTFVRARAVTQSNTHGGASVGVAAAVKLYFTLVSSNIFEAIYYRTASTIETNAPWSYIALAFIAFVILVAIIRKYFSFNIGIKKKSSKDDNSNDSNDTEKT